LGIHERTKLKFIFQIRWEGLDQVHRDQDMEKWQAVVNTVTNILFP
jgi:hypothetical protein